MVYQKKILAFLIVIILLFSNAVLAKSEPTLDMKNIQMKHKVLSDLQILQMGSEEPNYSGEFTKAEFASIIARLLGYLADTVVTDARFAFKDVSENALYFSDINIAINNQIIKGNGDGFFYPEKAISYTQAIKMLVCLLGYEPLALEKNGYPYGYIAVGNDIGLDMKFSESVEEPATLASIIELVYSAIDIKLFEQTSFSVDTKYTKSEDTILSRNMKIIKNRGIVTANEFTHLTSRESSIKKGTVQINSDICEIGETDAINLLGYHVDYYYKQEDANSEKVLVGIYINNSNDVLDVSAEQIDSYDSQTREFNYWVGDEDNKKHIQIPQVADIIFNGRAISSVPTDKMLMPDSGNVVFIDNNSDGKYETIIITSYITYVVKSANKNTETVIEAMGIQQSLKLNSNTNNDFTVIKNGKLTNLSKIAPWDIIAVTADIYKTITIKGKEYTVIDNNASTLYRLTVVGTTAISGIITEITDKEVFIGDKEYKLSESYKNAIEASNSSDVKKPVLGENASIYLDIEGKIAAIELGSTKNQYAYLVNANLSKGLDKKLELKLFTSDGNVDKYKTADKVNLYKQWTNAFSTPEANVYSKQIDSQNILNESEFWKDDLHTNFNSQLIKYKLNSENQVSEIQLSVKLSTTDRLSDYKSVFSLSKSLPKGESIYFHEANGSFGFRYDVTGSTVKFVVPDSLLASDDLYYIFNQNFKNDGGYDYIDFYDVQPSGKINAMVMHKEYVGSDNSGLDIDFTDRPSSFIVDRITNIINEKTGEDGYKIYGFEEGKIVSYYVKNKNLVSRQMSEANTAFPISKLVKGDQIIIGTNNLNEITGFRILFHDITKKSQTGSMIKEEYSDFGNVTIGEDNYAGAYYARGLITEMIDGFSFLDCDSTIGITRRFGAPQNVYEYNVGSNLLRKIDYSTVSVGDYVCIYYCYGYLRSVVVLTNY